MFNLGREDVQKRGYRKNSNDPPYSRKELMQNGFTFPTPTSETEAYNGFSGASSPSDDRGRKELKEIESYLSERAAYLSSQPRPCNCNVHRGAEIAHPCHNMRRYTSHEMMEKETKLVVLEYLSTLSPDQLSARNKSPKFREETTDVTYHKAVKAQTIAVSDEGQRQELMKKIQEAGSKRVSRSQSDVWDGYSNRQEKLRRMQVPIRKWMKRNLHKDILNFNTANLRRTETETTGKSPRETLFLHKDIVNFSTANLRRTETETTGKSPSETPYIQRYERDGVDKDFLVSPTSGASSRLSLSSTYESEEVELSNEEELVEPILGVLPDTEPEAIKELHRRLSIVSQMSCSNQSTEGSLKRPQSLR